MIATAKLDEMAGGFIDAALWADCIHADDDGNGEHGGCEHLTADDALSTFALESVTAFVAAAGDGLIDHYASERRYDPSEGSVWTYIGHDLWLSCHRHGTGLWDRGVSGDVGETLHALATDMLAHVEHVYPIDNGDGTAGLSD